ncbi:MAG TPA: VTT domain-containing protein [Blastocatellia bacterium]|nr:VTT domain-containing protein [Blastocatellia bacterium]
MKYWLFGITGAIKSLQAVLVGLGVTGVLAIGLLDAAMIPLPGGADLVVMTLSHLNPAMMPLYVLVAVIGSTFGCLVPYWIGRQGGQAALRRFSEEKRARVNELIGRYDTWAMLVGALLPPPFPFKLFLLSAGVFRMHIGRFLLALAIGRVIRFVLEGWMAVRYGDQATMLFKQHYPKIGLAMAAAVIMLFLLNSLRNRRQRGEELA